MRMAFGLAGLLVAVAILAYIYSSYTEQVGRSSAQVRPVAEQIAGVESGPLSGHVSEHIKLAPYEGPDGKVRAITVTQIDPGSSMQAYYALRVGDQITEVGPITVRDTDSGVATAMVQEAYQRKYTLVVVREGQRLSLPQPRKAPAQSAPPAQPQAVSPTPASPAAPAPAPGPAAPTPQPARPSDNPLQRQLDSIKNYGQ